MELETKIFYRTQDNIALCGLFTIPKIVRGYSLLLHGITTDKNEWENLYSDLAQEFSKHNLASLRFDFRGHGESGGTLRDMTIKGEELDIEASADKISEQWSNGLSIFATSFSAGPAILYAAQNRNIVDRLVLLCPVLDYDATFLNPITPWAKKTFNEDGLNFLNKHGYILLDGEFELGSKLIDEFRLIKPYEILQGLDCPVLTMHGSRDSLVPYEISKKYGQPNSKSRFITLAGAEHGFADCNDYEGNSQKSIDNKRFIIKKAIDWLESGDIN